MSDLVFFWNFCFLFWILRFHGSPLFSSLCYMRWSWGVWNRGRWSEEVISWYEPLVAGICCMLAGVVLCVLYKQRLAAQLSDYRDNVSSRHYWDQWTRGSTHSTHWPGHWSHFIINFRWPEYWIWIELMDVSIREGQDGRSRFRSLFKHIWMVLTLLCVLK